MRAALLFFLITSIFFACNNSDDIIEPTTQTGIHIFGGLSNGRSIHLLNGVEQIVPDDFNKPINSSASYIRFKTIYKNPDDKFSYFFSELDANFRVLKTYEYSDHKKEVIPELEGCVFLSGISSDGSIPWGSCAESGLMHEIYYNPDKNFFLNNDGTIQFSASGDDKLALRKVLIDTHGKIHTLHSNYTSTGGVGSFPNDGSDVYEIDGVRQNIDLAGIEPRLLLKSGEIELHGTKRTLDGSYEVKYVDGEFIPKTYLPENSVINAMKYIDGKLVEFGFAGSTNNNFNNGFGFYTIDQQVYEVLDDNVSFYIRDGIILNNEVHLIGSTISKYTNEWKSVYLKDGVWQPYSDKGDLNLHKIMFINND